MAKKKGSTKPTSLFEACDHPNAAVHVHDLLTSGFSPNEKDEHGLYPLHYAVRAGSLPAVNRLLKENNINLNCRSPTGETPLMALVKRGADISLEDNSKRIALDHICLTRNKAMADEMETLLRPPTKQKQTTATNQSRTPKQSEPLDGDKKHVCAQCGLIGVSKY
ncbi:hypothetical protein PROFUN_08357 [Planoprotostelium fungivorum]|uniref:Uncharacterized protein n=1 Tax=Planoprotostelium fungivorum TaxID=1890364 RepID=A0A2P6NI70_9EUKA|nr:hypothetical protein PROFUN_08357 [Planoprotostelium fungivorum]